MPTWNPNRNPDKFPARWHAVLRESPGLYLVEMSDDPAHIKRCAFKFNLLKACLRKHPLHKTTEAMSKREYRLSKETYGEMHSLWVTVTWAEEFLRSVEEALLEEAGTAKERSRK